MKISERHDVSIIVATVVVRLAYQLYVTRLSPILLRLTMLYVPGLDLRP